MSSNGGNGQKGQDGGKGGKGRDNGDAVRGIFISVDQLSRITRLDINPASRRITWQNSSSADSSVSTA